MPKGYNTKWHEYQIIIYINYNEAAIGSKLEKL